MRRMLKIQRNTARFNSTTRFAGKQRWHTLFEAIPKISNQRMQIVSQTEGRILRIIVAGTCSGLAHQKTRCASSRDNIIIGQAYVCEKEECNESTSLGFAEVLVRASSAFHDYASSVV